MKKLSITKMAEVVDFEVVDLFEEEKKADNTTSLDRAYNIAVAGTGYVGLSIATLLAQHNHVTPFWTLSSKNASCKFNSGWSYKICI